MSSFSPDSLDRQAKAECLLLDKLLEGFKIKNDAHLAIWLDVDNSLISSVRAGRRRLGLVPRLRILDHIGFLKARSILESILPENLAREVAAFNQRLVNAQIQSAMDAAKNPSVGLLEVTKQAFQLQTDAALAEFLHVKGNTIATVRSGKSSLGPTPRLRILQRITRAFDTENLLSLVKTDNLIRLIEKWTNQSPPLPGH